MRGSTNLVSPQSSFLSLLNMHGVVSAFQLFRDEYLVEKTCWERLRFWHDLLSHLGRSSGSHLSWTSFWPSFLEFWIHLRVCSFCSWKAHCLISSLPLTWSSGLELLLMLKMRFFVWKMHLSREQSSFETASLCFCACWWQQSEKFSLSCKYWIDLQSNWLSQSACQWLLGP